MDTPADLVLCDLPREPTSLHVEGLQRHWRRHVLERETHRARRTGAARDDRIAAGGAVRRRGRARDAGTDRRRIRSEARAGTAARRGETDSAAIHRLAAAFAASATDSGLASGASTGFVLSTSPGPATASVPSLLILPPRDTSVGTVVPKVVEF